jgi:tRNA pseudouridine55 synthase
MIHGMLAVDKPEGLSSARVVARVKQVLGAGKVGHTGTLDPFATGLLLLGINQGTRISRFVLGGDKTYQATLSLGVETDTQDLTGKVVATAEPGLVEALDPEAVLRVVLGMEGPLKQTPPVYSALKHEGKPLYKLARQGRAVEKPARDVVVYGIRVDSIRLPRVDFVVRCSSGTYIRTLAHDMGRMLGCGGHLTALRRMETCGFTVDGALSLPELEAMSPRDIEARVIPMARVLGFMPALEAGATLAEAIRFGRPLAGDMVPGETKASGSPFLRVLDSGGNLLAVLEKTGGNYNYCCVFNE